MVDIGLKDAVLTNWLGVLGPGGIPQEIQAKLSTTIADIMREPDTKKKSNKDEPDWGEIPKGSRADLINDIAGILDEAITNIDDVGRRDEKNPLIARSLRRLTVAANLYAGQFNLIRSHTSNDDELSAIERVLDYTQQIVEVGGKLPPPAPEKTKSKP